MTHIPEDRVRAGNRESLNQEGDHILYWMTAYRRLGWNFALEHAAFLARELGKPLVILDALRVDYPYVSHRFHRFILDGMGERARALKGGPVLHVPYVEPEPGAGKGLLSALADRSCAVVTDDYPSFFLPRMVATAGRRLRVRLDVVDSNGLLPLREPDREFSAAYHFRRFLQKRLPDHFLDLPEPDPLDKPLPAAPGTILEEVESRFPWPRNTLLDGDAPDLSGLPIDDSVPPAEETGRTESAVRRLRVFLAQSLHRYAAEGRDPDRGATSGLSPHLHFGTLSSHQVFREVADHEGWSPLRLSERTDGARSGWWGMSEGAEAFLDQLVTWRELGFNMASRRSDHRTYESLPGWARATLEDHEGDPRPFLYTLEEFQEARTHDPLWNAAQRQLARDGVIHNYLRMLWGKKILHWTPGAREALDIMIELNDRYALDGRDPNSYSGIFWTLGRYDRGWPERPVFGKVRSMSSDATRRKVLLNKYLDEFADESV
jgi:deoxyribodipyrimidine photo-lyase